MSRECLERVLVFRPTVWRGGGGVGAVVTAGVDPAGRAERLTKRCRWSIPPNYRRPCSGAALQCWWASYAPLPPFDSMFGRCPAARTLRNSIEARGSFIASRRPLPGPHLDVAKMIRASEREGIDGAARLLASCVKACRLAVAGTSTCRR